jgi:hypothetical protein
VKALVSRWWKIPVGKASRGQVLIWAAVMIPSMLMITSLGLDMGRVVMIRRALQNSVDAAALAGAWNLPDDQAAATDEACFYIDNNAIDNNAVPEMTGAHCGGKADVTFPSATKIKVTSVRELEWMFHSIVPLPLPSITFGADATAAVGSIHELCVFPMFQTQDTLVASGAWQPNGDDMLEFNVPVVMKTSADDNAAGNFMFLEVPGNPGGNAIRTALGSPGSCSGGEVSDTANTKTGSTVGPLDQGMVDRRKLYMDPASAGYCPDAAPTFDAEGVAIHPYKGGEPLTPDNCYRLVQIPLLEGDSSTFTGQTTAPIRGFLTFYISNWCGQSSTPKLGSGSDAKHCAAPAGTTLPELKNGELWGYYLKYEARTDEEVQEYDGLGTKVVVLIE